MSGVGWRKEKSGAVAMPQSCDGGGAEKEARWTKLGAVRTVGETGPRGGRRTRPVADAVSAKLNKGAAAASRGHLSGSGRLSVVGQVRSEMASQKHVKQGL